MTCSLVSKAAQVSPNLEDPIWPIWSRWGTCNMSSFFVFEFVVDWRLEVCVFVSVHTRFSFFLFAAFFPTTAGDENIHTHNCIWKLIYEMMQNKFSVVVLFFVSIWILFNDRIEWRWWIKIDKYIYQRDRFCFFGVMIWMILMISKKRRLDHDFLLISLLFRSMLEKFYCADGRDAFPRFLVKVEASLLLFCFLLWA